ARFPARRRRRGRPHAGLLRAPARGPGTRPRRPAARPLPRLPEGRAAPLRRRPAPARTRAEARRRRAPAAARRPRRAAGGRRPRPRAGGGRGGAADAARTGARPARTRDRRRGATGGLARVPRLLRRRRAARLRRRRRAPRHLHGRRRQPPDGRQTALPRAAARPRRRDGRLAGRARRRAALAVRGSEAVSLSPQARHRLLALGAGVPDPAGRYRVVREVGRGGMGVVYEAEDLHLHRRVALKVLAAPEPAPAARLQREALAAARLSHPNIAAIYDASPEAIAMQFVAGHPLAEEPRGDVRRIVRLLRDAARAVHYAHGEGIVHRDLKPTNLLVEGDTVFVVDFGLAKDEAVDASRSASGGLLGTPSFMAPEQTQGRPADARTDVWALGATLHAALTARPPLAPPHLPPL